MQLKETIFGDGMKKEGLEKGKITFGGMMAQDAKEPEEISEGGMPERKKRAYLPILLDLSTPPHHFILSITNNHQDKHKWVLLLYSPHTSMIHKNTGFP